jgi:hypothetical protein
VQHGVWEAMYVVSIRSRTLAVLGAQRSSASMHRARRARYGDTCFARGAEGGPRACGANCLDFQERWSYLALSAAQLDSPEAAGPVNARRSRTCDWDGPGART